MRKQGLRGDGRSTARWLHRFAAFVAACTLVLIALGGLVTSKGVGMAVPDWPTTYGYNMFFFPVGLWEGGIRDEHIHRLVASVVGLLTVVLTVWIQLVERRRWLKNLAWGALALVIVQGILGGTRVLLNDIRVFGIPGSAFFGVLHAATAQLFLCLVGMIAWCMSSTWKSDAKIGHPVALVTPWVFGLTGLMFIQLLVAATMRHQHAGLAIPDFPLAYGVLYPPTDEASLVAINQHRIQMIDDLPVTAVQIHLQMVHRLLALVLLTGVGWVGLQLVKAEGMTRRWSLLWCSLLLVQCGLGAATIWTDKAADFATAHVVVGAVSLLTGVLFSSTLLRQRRVTGKDISCPRPVQFLNQSSTVSGTPGAVLNSAN